MIPGFRRMKKGRLVLTWLAVAAVCGGSVAQEAGRSVEAGIAAKAANGPGAEAPRIFYTKPGQFEIIVAKAEDAQPALALGRSVWAGLSGPLGLPADGFSTPVSVWLVPAELWNSPAPFLVTVETPGRVNVRVRWAEDSDPLHVRRAFVQGAILRQAVSWHGISAQLTVPLWLEQAGTAWSLVRERPAMLDSFQQESIGITSVPPLSSLLRWERGAVESRTWELASLWLFLQLQSEPGEASRWGGWIRGVVGGADPMDTLPRSYRGLWTNALAMELWWQTAFQHQRRQVTLPVMTAEASRGWLADRSRWLGGRGGREVVIGLGELRELRKEAWVREELTLRGKQAQSVLGVLHPYYANAALSMGKLYTAALKGGEKEFKEALAAFERDALDGRELEDQVGAMLDTAPRK